MPRAGETIKGADGQLRVWQPDTKNAEMFNYLGESSGFSSLEDALHADEESGQGSYVPASNVEKWPWWLKAFVTTGLVSMGVTGIGALAAPGAFGGAAGAGGAGGAAGGTGYVGADIASVASHGVGPAIAGGAGGAGGAGSTAYVANDIASVAGHGAGPAAGGGGVLGYLKNAFGGKGSTLNNLGAASQILGGAAEGSARGREAEALINLRSDELRQRQAEQERQAAIDKAKLELDQRVTGQDMETQARRQAAWGQFVQKPGNPFTVPDYVKARVGGTPDYSGYSSIGSDAYRDAQQRLLTGADKKFMEQPNIPSPTLTPQPSPSTLDKINQFASLFGGLAGAFGGYRTPTR